jgi:hypothetical protein
MSLHRLCTLNYINVRPAVLQATNRTKIVDRPLLVRTLPLKPTTINTVRTVPLNLPNHIFLIYESMGADSVDLSSL